MSELNSGNRIGIGNKLILYSDFCPNQFKHYRFKAATEGWIDRAYEEQLGFTISWDWLMPVVEKILKWYNEESDNYFDAVLEEIKLSGNDPLEILNLRVITPINRVWEFVIHFIEWLNSAMKAQGSDTTAADSSNTDH